MSCRGNRTMRRGSSTRFYRRVRRRQHNVGVPSVSPIRPFNSGRAGLAVKRDADIRRREFDENGDALIPRNPSVNATCPNFVWPDAFPQVESPKLSTNSRNRSFASPNISTPSPTRTLSKSSASN
jgi:hypothetical protein